MRKDDLNVHVFQNRNWCSPYGGKGLISEKTEALYAELNERMEAATSSYTATDRFLQYIKEILYKKE